jgi:hypothetical protein
MQALTWTHEQLQRFITFVLLSGTTHNSAQTWLLLTPSLPETEGTCEKEWLLVRRWSQVSGEDVVQSTRWLFYCGGLMKLPEHWWKCVWTAEMIILRNTYVKLQNNVQGILFFIEVSISVMKKELGRHYFSACLCMDVMNMIYIYIYIYIYIMAWITSQLYWEYLGINLYFL